MALFSGLTIVVACGGPGTGADGLIDQETFITSYVDLRMTALATEVGELDDTLRAEVLERNGVSEQSLVDFVEHHGEDLALMQDIWDEIESRMDASGPSADSVPRG
jgi:hypothetical protein